MTQRGVARLVERIEDLGFRDLQALAEALHPTVARNLADALQARGESARELEQ